MVSTVLKRQTVISFHHRVDPLYQLSSLEKKGDVVLCVFLMAGLEDKLRESSETRDVLPWA